MHNLAQLPLSCHRTLLVLVPDIICSAVKSSTVLLWGGVGKLRFDSPSSALFCALVCMVTGNNKLA